MNVLVVAPHPDDETLGCGGTLLRHAAQGDTINWLIVTELRTDLGYTHERVSKRKREIEKVSGAYGFSNVDCLGYPTTMLDTLPMKDLVSDIASVFNRILPESVYCPFPGDVHSDHLVVYKAVESCSKWFRFESVKSVYVYETISETDLPFGLTGGRFEPNVFVDISQYLDKKMEIMNLYEGEMGEFPFPRSDVAIRSLAHLRGASSGYQAAESFMLVRERR